MERRRASWSDGAFLGCLGVLVGRSWGALEVLLGLLWGILGPSWGSLGGLGGLLGLFLGVWDASWGHLGPHCSKRGGPPIPIAPSEALKERLGALLGRSWSAPGRSWGCLGALLGPFWGPPGPSWSHLEASDGHRKRIGEKANIISLVSLRFLKDFLFLGGALGELFGFLEASWGGLGAYWSILGGILMHLGLS